MASPRKFAEAMRWEYPVASVKAREQGTARLQVCVEADGKITEVKILTGTGYERLDAATLRAVKGQKAIPAKDEAGEAVRFCTFQVEVAWSMGR
jgi:TonB family protein